MKKRCTEEQINSFLREDEAAVAVSPGGGFLAHRSTFEARDYQAHHGSPLRGARGLQPRWWPEQSSP